MSPRLTTREITVNPAAASKIVFAKKPSTPNTLPAIARMLRKTALLDANAEQRKSCQTQNDAKPQGPRVFRRVAHASHVALRVNRHNLGEVCRHREIERTGQRRIQFTHEETLRLQFGSARRHTA